MHRRTVLRSIAVTLAVPLATTAVAACGSTPPPAPRPPVHLSLQTPVDDARVDTGSVTLTGTVSPVRAQVTVLGHRVTVARDGSFQTKVPLSVGTNLIDVLAGYARSQPALTAIRVIRYQLITVPSVTGRSPKSAAEALRARGLTARTQGNGDPLAFLLPIPEQVCSQSPKAGSHVAPGATVTLHTAKVCL
jgi:hypothetical protein